MPMGKRSARERRRTNYQIHTNRTWRDESFEIKLRDRKQEGAVKAGAARCGGRQGRRVRKNRNNTSRG